MTKADLRRWKADPLAFIREALVDPETGKPFRLYDAQERFLIEAFSRRPDGKLKYVEQVFGAPKKQGKTALAGMWTLTLVLVLGGRFAEGYCIANDLDQSKSRVFEAIKRIIAASPLLKKEARVTAERIDFPATGAFIQALASDAAGAAGSNPTAICFDELWGFALERSRRLWDECTTSPTRKISARLTVSYAGFTGESLLLQELHDRGKAGVEISPDLYVQPGLVCMWLHYPCAPWCSEEWVDEMRRTMRPSAFARQILNQFVASEGEFIPMDWWDRCEVLAGPVVRDAELRVWVGIDASVKRDTTAVVACAWDAEQKKVRLVWHRVFRPSKDAPLDFEATIEATILELREKFALVRVYYDPFQMVASAQRLTAQNVPMVEYPQSLPNLTATSGNLYELVKGANLMVYRDADLRHAVAHAVAVEKARGWLVRKDKQAAKIDVLIALSQAALGAVQEGQAAGDMPVARNLARDSLRTALTREPSYADEFRAREREGPISLRGLPRPGSAGWGRRYGT